jgi:hypothetical protein
LVELQQAGYVSVETTSVQRPVPVTSLFVVVGGATQPAPWRVDGLARGLTVALANRRMGVLVAESQTSVWGLTSVIRDDAVAGRIVWTDDQANTPAGRISLALGLARAQERPAQHFGTGPGATEVMPKLASRH